MGVSIPGKEGDEVSAVPNVVPLCDVLLVLLIIFMVVTPLIQKGVDVRLPTALNTIDMPENPEVVLHIKKGGALYLNEEQVQMDNLALLLEEALLAAGDKRLYLRADGELEYGNVVDIIEIMKDAGVEIVGIITDKKTERID
ncbi:MAG: biopolymer transporter ExbD [Candidatus Aminicenantes bacterium]|jgi:biopolymer transport protein TolR|nr:biopolymer transporter ExbD [Candidatus Aminicenantes bacterium]